MLNREQIDKKNEIRYVHQLMDMDDENKQLQQFKLTGLINSLEKLRSELTTVACVSEKHLGLKGTHTRDILISEGTFSSNLLL